MNPFLARRVRARAASPAEVAEHQVVEQAAVDHAQPDVDVDQLVEQGELVGQADLLQDVDQVDQAQDGGPGGERVVRRSRVRTPLPARDRRHTAGRRRTVAPRFTDEEYEVLAAAAAGAGLTPTGYVAQAALAAATGGRGPAVAPEREALVELMQARTQLRRYGTNVNQAIAALNSKGEAPAWLEHAVERTAAAVERVDRAAALLARRADR